MKLVTKNLFTREELSALKECLAHTAKHLSQLSFVTPEMSAKIDSSLIEAFRAVKVETRVTNSVSNVCYYFRMKETVELELTIEVDSRIIPIMLELVNLGVEESTPIIEALYGIYKLYDSKNIKDGVASIKDKLNKLDDGSRVATLTHLTGDEVF